MGELLDAVKGSPLLLAFLVVGGFIVYAVEKLGGLDGPVSRALRAWQDRELRALRREALLRAEARRIDAEERSDRERDLLVENARLRRERDEAIARAGGDPSLSQPVPRLTPARRHRAADDPATEPMRRESARPPGARR